MDEQKKKKKDPTVYVAGQNFPEKPGLMDYVTEAFEPKSTRADLDAVRKRRAKGS